jgi:hypothetical protein
MLSFISSLFTPSQSSTTDLDESLINLAIERAVDGTDVRLRAVRDYKRRLREPVIAAVEHITSLVDEIPAATELSPEAFSDDPRLRAFFASPKRISEVAGGFPSLRELRRSGPKPLPANLYGLLSMEWSERDVLGMGLVGSQVRRGVAQVVVNFSDHRFLCPSATEDESRRAIKRRVYDYVLAQALARLGNTREQRSQLREQHRLLKRKLECLNTGQWGLESMFSPAECETFNEAALELEVASLDAELEKLGGSTGSLDATLNLVSDSLMSVRTSLSLQPLELHLDYRGVRAENPDAKGFNTVELEEVHVLPDRRRIILMCRLPRTALPEKKDFLREAERLLY